LGVQDVKVGEVTEYEVDLKEDLQQLARAMFPQAQVVTGASHIIVCSTKEWMSREK